MRLIGTTALVALLAGCGGSSTVVAQGDGGGSGVGAPAIAAEERPSGEWRTITIKGDAEPPQVLPKSFDLRFFDDGRVIAQARCNSISGPWRVEDGRFRMDEAAQTEMGCPGENRHEEDQWLSAFLTSGPTYEFTGSQLTLGGHKAAAKLAPREQVQPNKPIVGTSWEVTHLTDGPAPGAPSAPDAAVSAGMPQLDIVVAFADGRVKGRSDCAMFEGPAAIDGGTIRFGELVVDSSCGSPRSRTVDAVLAVLDGDVLVKQHVATLTLTHATGKGLQLSAVETDAVDSPGSPPPVGSGSAEPGSAARGFSGEWRATSISEEPSSHAPGVKPDAFALFFHQDDGVGARARCNSIGGTYRMVEGRLHVRDIGQTLMGCSAENAHEEDRWLNAFLESKPLVDVDGGSLRLSTEHITVVFEPAK